jgi:hypothetical protein
MNSTLASSRGLLSRWTVPVRALMRPAMCGLSVGPGNDSDREGGDHDGLQEKQLRALWGEAPAVTVDEEEGCPG